ncbi:RHS repeat-associated core domain-containing protein [Pseudomonas sp. S2_E01]
MMLTTDQKQTVLAGVSETAQVASVYSAYGYREEESATHGLIGFNGEVREEGTSWYLLGNGHRVYNPKLMKFHSPDDYGPYGEAGFNLYAYCLGDPVNYVDPTGNVPGLFSILRGAWRVLKSVFGPARYTSKGAKAGRTSQVFSTRPQGGRVGPISSSSNPNAAGLGSPGTRGPINFKHWGEHGTDGLAKASGLEFYNPAKTVPARLNTTRPAPVSFGPTYDIPYETAEAPVKTSRVRPVAVSKGADRAKQTRSSQVPAADPSKKVTQPVRRTVAKKKEATVDANEAVRQRIEEEGKFQWEQ